MSDSKDYNTAGNAITGAENSNPSIDSRSSSGSAKNPSTKSTSNQTISSASSRRKSSRSTSNTNSGSSKSQTRSRIKSFKKLVLLGIYGGMMLVSVSRMMNEQLMRSFWMDLAAFGVLWIYYVLSTQKISKLITVSTMWFYSHALVILFHLSIALFLGDVDVSVGGKPIHENIENKPVVQPYPVGE